MPRRAVFHSRSPTFLCRATCISALFLRSPGCGEMRVNSWIAKSKLLDIALLVPLIASRKGWCCGEAGRFGKRREGAVNGPRSRERQWSGRSPRPCRRADDRPSARAPDRSRAVQATGFGQRQYAGPGGRRLTGAMTGSAPPSTPAIPPACSGRSRSTTGSGSARIIRSGSAGASRAPVTMPPPREAA